MITLKSSVNPAEYKNQYQIFCFEIEIDSYVGASCFSKLSDSIFGVTTSIGLSKIRPQHCDDEHVLRSQYFHGCW